MDSMDSMDDRTLSVVMNDLLQMGYKEDFKAEGKNIRALYAKKDYQPKDLLIEKSFRFEGMTNPSDSTQLFVIKTNDGLKGTLVMSYSAEHNQNTDLIKQIPQVEETKNK